MTETAHCYLYVRCKTPDCPGVTILAHEVVPTDVWVDLEYPDEWFPLPIECPTCHQTYLYAGTELKHETSTISLHPPGWQPVFDALPRPPGRK